MTGTADPLDSLDAVGAARALPDAVAGAVESARAGLADAAVHAPTALVLAGRGHQVAAAAVEAIAAHRVDLPVVVASEVPDWVGESTVVVDFAGGHASAAHVVSLAPAPRPQPIAQAAAALAALGELGLLPGIGSELTDAAGHLREVLTAHEVEEGHDAATLARRIGRTMVLAYGGGPVGRAAALSWKWSVNRNAKVPAFANAVPGLDHDEIVGWAQHGDVTRQVFTLVLLRHGGETPDEAARLDSTAETCDEIVADLHTVRSHSASRVSALFELMLRGELTSLAMAADAGVDPGPTPILERYS